jgi:EAL domain-containing protein (putative c-di-GMP-specific phosphodiesterase class I)
MLSPARRASRFLRRRDSAGRPLSPLGRLLLWCPSSSAQSKILAQLRSDRIEYDLADGACVIIDVEWDTVRELVIPLRRVLTHQESDDVRVLYKPGGGDLSTADIPRVQSYTAFSSVTESAWLSDMLIEKRFTSVLQPIVWSAEPRRVFAREALLRGVALDGGVVYPAYIFDVARGCGMLVDIDQAARQAAIDRMVLDEIGETLFVNITPSTMDDPISSLERTLAMIDGVEIAHDRIVFEVVESDQAHDVNHLKALLRCYREAGFRVALDDVGAGYSSLNLLHQLRPDFVKLDMDLIRGVHADPYQALIAEKIIEIASTLGVGTIAEGVETADELAWVQSHGATYAQGYAIARPSEPMLGARTPAAMTRLVS